jgi:hypothetical protein
MARETNSVASHILCAHDEVTNVKESPQCDSRFQ